MQDRKSDINPNYRARKEKYDLIIVGHMCYDEIDGRKPTPGSAVLCSAMAAVSTGKDIAAVTRMNQRDIHLLDSMERARIDCYNIQAPETTYMKVVHLSPNPDDREMTQVKSAGYFKSTDVPYKGTKALHLAGVTNQEFNMDFITMLSQRYDNLSTDMQSYVRQVDTTTRKISYADVPEKKEIVRLMQRLKLDCVEASILTGTEDLQRAAAEISSWGCPEVMVTSGDGILVHFEGRNYFEKFSNSNLSGRTGRGDTTFGAYLARRVDGVDVEQALKFAAALVSIKMETPGPFKGTIEEVLVRMREKHN